MILATLMLTLAAAAHRNACEVLTRSDVAAVQGEAFTDAKLTTRGETSQCFYQLPTFVKSVSLDVTRPGRDFWRDTFEENAEAEPGEAGEEAQHPPRRIRGVGDEAFWVGSHVAGSLYVRKGNAVLRVSVGGAGTEAEKISKSKALARRALARM